MQVTEKPQRPCVPLHKRWKERERGPALSETLGEWLANTEVMKGQAKVTAGQRPQCFSPWGVDKTATSLLKWLNRK